MVHQGTVVLDISIARPKIHVGRSTLPVPVGFLLDDDGSKRPVRMYYNKTVRPTPKLQYSIAALLRRTRSVGLHAMRRPTRECLPQRAVDRAEGDRRVRCYIAAHDRAIVSSCLWACAASAPTRPLLCPRHHSDAYSTALFTT